MPTDEEIDEFMRYQMLAGVVALMGQNPPWWGVLERAVSKGLEKGLWQGSRRAFVGEVERDFVALGQTQSGRQLLEILDPDDSMPLATTLTLAERLGKLDAEDVMKKFDSLRERFAPQVRRLNAMAAD